MDKLQGFAPDAPPDTPGVFTDCQHIIPTATGFAGAPTGVAALPPALETPARGAVVVTRLDDTRRIFAGTRTRLYELLGNVWTDRSAGGLPYSGGTDSRWSFAQFGDTTIASNLTDPMQASTSGAFAAIAGAPKAKVIVSASNNFVLAFNTSDSTYGVSPDRWWCCAQNNQTDWTPSISTAAATGRLIGAPGSIQAAAQLGDYVVAYKTRGVFLGQAVPGDQGSWQWTLIRGSQDCGAVGSEAVCDIGGVHFVVGDDDFWLFDGVAPVSVGDEVREWFRANSSQTYRYRTRATFDRQRQLVWVSFVRAGSASGDVDSCICWHIKRKRWGRSDFVMQAALTYTTPGVTIEGLAAYGATYAALPDIPYDSAYWFSGGRAFAYFDQNSRLVVASGSCVDSSIMSGDIGQPGVTSELDRFTVQFTQEPTRATATGFCKETSGGAMRIIGTETIYDGRFDMRQTARLHRVRVDMLGDHAETGWEPRLRADGAR